MARRIALTMLSLIGALLLTAVVPLGLITTARERASFRQDTVLTARAFAASAEDAVTEPGQSPAIVTFLGRASRSGEIGWVYNAAGRLIAHTTGAGTPGRARRAGCPGPGNDACRPARRRHLDHPAARPVAGGRGGGPGPRPATGRGGGTRPVHRRA